MNTDPDRSRQTKDRIAVIIPTRDRVASLRALFDSLESTIEEKPFVSVWLYVDDDDASTIAFAHSEAVRNYTFAIEWHIAPRTPSNGEMMNILARLCSERCEILFPIADDYVFETRGWDRIIRDCFAAYDDGIALAFPDEASATQDQVTLAIVGSSWARTVGRLFTPYFPYWFDDSWIDQVSRMVGRRHKLAISVNPQGGKGKTIRMRCLAFWTSMFNLLLDERVAEAERLLQVIHANDPNALRLGLNAAHKAAAAYQAGPIDPVHTVYLERLFSGDDSASQPSARYLGIERFAVQHLIKKALTALRSNDAERALSLLRAVDYASHVYSGVHVLRATAASLYGQRALALQELDREIAAQGETVLAAMLREHVDRPEGMLTRIDQIDVRALRAAQPLIATLHAHERLRLALMPLTLRIEVFTSVLRSRSVRQWPSTFADIVSRFLRRRRR